MENENPKRVKWELKLKEQSTTPTQLQAYSEPQWIQLMLEMAQDMRHDLSEPVVRFWKEKLKNHADYIICDALVTGCWKLFPSADEVREQIHLLQEQRRQASANDDWNRFKYEQQRAEQEGLLAREEDYAALREGMKKLGDSKAIISLPKNPIPVFQNPLTDAQLRDRREMLRQQTAKIIGLRKEIIPSKERRNDKSQMVEGEAETTGNRVGRRVRD